MAVSFAQPDARRGALLPLLIAVILIPAVIGSSTTIFNDGDVSWHLAAGQWMLAHWALPTADPFSLTRAGAHWVPFEWGSEVVYAAAFRLAGYAGVAAVVTAALAALFLIVFANAARFIRPWVALVVVVVLVLVLIPMALARPHLLGWGVVAGWTGLMIRARERGRAPPLVAALLMTAWANLHGSWVIGLGIAAAFAFEAVAAGPDRRGALVQWGVFGLASLLAAMVNANGLDGFLHPIRVAGLTTLPLIDEWKPSSLTVTPFFFAVLGAVLLLIAVTRPRLHWVRWLMLAGLLAMALMQMRHQAMLAIVAAMILPTGYGIGRDARQPWPPARFAAAAIALLATVRALLPIAPVESETNPWRLIAAIPPDLRARPVLNGYSMGGPLILAGYRPFIDGRSDFYGDRMVADYKKISDGDRATLDAAVRRWNIGWMILPHRYTKLLTVLDGSPGWRRIADQESGVIYVRR